MRSDQIVHAGRPEDADAANGVVKLSQEEFASFVMEHPYSIVLASKDVKRGSYPFSTVLQLGVFHAPTVRLGVVDLATIKWTPSVQFGVRLGLERLNLKLNNQGEPPTGFYLFARGVPIGFHEGGVDLEKDGENILWGTLTGLLVGAFTQNEKAALKTGTQIAQWKVGERVAEKFSHLIKQHQDQSLYPQGESVPAAKHRKE